MASLFEKLMDRQKEAKEERKESDYGTLVGLRKAMRKRSGVDISEDGMGDEEQQPKDKKDGN